MRHPIFILLAMLWLVPQEGIAQFTPSDSTEVMQLLQQSTLMLRSGRKDAAVVQPTYQALDILRKKEGHPLLFYAIQAKLGDFYTQTAKVDSAYFYYARNLEIVENDLGKDSKYYPYALSSMAAVNFAKGEYKAAAKRLKTSLVFLKKQPTPDVRTNLRIYWQLGSTYSEWGKLDSSLWAFENVRTVARKNNFTDPAFKPSIYSTIAKLHMMKGDLSLATSMIDSALLHIPPAWGKNNPLLGTCIGLQADILILKQEYHGALEKYKEATRITQALAQSPDDVNIAFAIAKEANAYISIHNIDQALKNYYRAISILRKKVEKDDPNLGRFYHSIAVAYDKLLDFESSLYYNLKALEIYEKRNMLRDADINAIYLNIGACYEGLENFDQAIEFLKIGVDKSIEALGETHFRLINLYTRLGGVYEELGQLGLAIAYYDKAIKVVEAIHGKDHFLISELLAIKAELVMHQGEYQKAKRQLEKSEELFLRTKKDGKYAIAPFTFISLNYRLAQSYFKLAKQYQPLVHYRKASLLFDELSLRMTDARQRFEGDQAKQMINYGLPIIYNWAIHTELVLAVLNKDSKHEEKAFYYAENAKAMLLLESLQEAKAEKIAGVPDSTLKKEKQIKESINIGDKEVFALLQKGKLATDSAVLVVQDRLYNLKNEYAILKKQIEADNPRFYDLKYNLSGISLKEVQQQLLTKGQTLVEYFVGDSSIFIFNIQKEAYQIIEVKKDFPLEEWVTNLNTGIQDYYTKPLAKQTDQLYKETLLRYNKFARLLYQKLVEPIKDQLNTRELIIIPDGILGYLPFGALLSDKPSKVTNLATYPFLEKAFEISYCYSATLLREMVTKLHRKPSRKSLLAFAPFTKAGYSKSDTTFILKMEETANGADSLLSLTRVRSEALGPLPASREEVLSIAQLWEGQLFLGEEATEGQFKAMASEFQILHLSTHGVIDSSSEFSYLAFAEKKDEVENEFLFVRELYNLELNADLVILSACKTALGKLLSGEGIISLARGFAFAGAKSIVTTLWVANDEAAKDLMIHFHHGLTKGKKKSKALQDAKKTLMEKRSNAHPFFWASFIPVGDMSPLK